jgi:proline iminopeptidase
MRKTIFRILLIAAVLTLGLLLFKCCTPASYAVPAPEERAGTRYWTLPTGSHLAYTKIAAKGARQPYPIVYLHGGPGGPIFNRNIALLAAFADDGYDVYLYDQLGGGRSARLDDISDYTAERHRRDLEAVIRQIGAEKVILIAQSWGAILATLLVAEHPELVDRIVFTSPGPIQPMRRELATAAPPDSLQLREPARTNAQANVEAQTLRTWFVSWCAEQLGWKLASDAEMDAFQTYLTQGLNKSTVCDTAVVLPAEAGAGFYVQRMTVRSFGSVADPRPRLRDCPVPVLILKGQCDNQRWGFTQEYAELFPDHRLVVMRDAGHSIAAEQPAAYLAAIRSFLDRN